MSPEWRNVAIGKALGFEVTRIDFKDHTTEHIKFIWAKYPNTWTGPDVRPWMPDFSRDLNVMHAAERWLFERHPHLRKIYRRILIDVAGDSLEEGFPYWNAPCSMRTEAFLKTLNLWTDEP